MADHVPDDEQLYQDIILERARAPRHGAGLACHDAEATGDNPMCGDRITVQLRHEADGRIAEIGHVSRGCAISVASADLMADAVIGRDAQGARDMSTAFVAMVTTGTVPDDAGLAPLRVLAGVHDYRSRIRCATLAWNALGAALDAHATSAYNTISQEMAHG